MNDATAVPTNAPGLVTLLTLGQRARAAANLAELAFIAVNDTHALCPYRQAVLWRADAGVTAISGVVQVEANAPFVQWINQVLAHIKRQDLSAGPVSAADLPESLRADWADWLPTHGLLVPFATRTEKMAKADGALVLFRDLPWSERERGLLTEWLAAWNLAWLVKQQHGEVGIRRWWRRAGSTHPATPRRRWYQRWPAWLAIGCGLLAAWPVPLTVLAPAELVPAKPAIVRAPLDGVIDKVHVLPNQHVQAGDRLFEFDKETLLGQLALARQAVATAEAEYKQAAQQAMAEPKFKAHLVALAGRINERTLEAGMLEERLRRADVVASQAGMVIFGDPTEWIGRPVVMGERVMRIADPTDVEIEAWVPLADAIPLEEGTAVSMFLKTSPLDPVRGQLKYLAYESVQRPDGQYAYRLRAQLDASTSHRAGLKGTARISGRRVAAAYWVLRRPWAALRGAWGY